MGEVRAVVLGRVDDPGWGEERESVGGLTMERGWVLVEAV